MKDIDWSTFPCESCPNYHRADHCECEKLNEWTKSQEDKSSIELILKDYDPDNSSIYEDIVYARKCIEDLAKYSTPGSANYKFVRAMRSVLVYADDRYVGHCEELGRIAIEDIERMKEDWINEASKYLNLSEDTKEKLKEHMDDEDL